MRKNDILNLCLGILILAFPIGGIAQTAFDGSSEGSIIIGYDNQTCNSSIEGAIRYNSSGGGMIQVCDGTSWTNWGE
jgi:hypothetical protein